MKKIRIFKDKEGNKLTFKEFITRWKSGIENVTPLQKTKIQLTGTKITLLGMFLGLCVSIYGWKNLWWVGIILIGAIINTGIQYLATKQQKKLYQKIEDNFKEADEESNKKTKEIMKEIALEDNSPQKKLENVKTSIATGNSDSFEPKTNRRCDLARNEKSKVVSEIKNKYALKPESNNRVSDEVDEDVGDISMETNLSENVDTSKKERKGVYIERAAKLDRKGIKAVCGTDKEYNKYVKDSKKEKGGKK